MKKIMGLIVGLALLPMAVAGNLQPRARDIGIAPGILAPGALNAITDVRGVKVGHVTIRESTRVNTGVTVIIPAGGNLYQDKVPAAIFVANGYGKLAGLTWLILRVNGMHTKNM